MKTNRKLKKAYLDKVAGKIVRVHTGAKLALTEQEQKDGTGVMAPKEKRMHILVLGKQGRNEQCSCGSGLKNKKCCGEKNIQYAMQLGFPYYLASKK